ncbi:helix-hairpin-helix domain-containing protein [Psychrobacter sanguinis]|uniref:helix-hairpin-helix domain-containing protein n=1 Tax=Psychrobacter sanguinis TaxID=861445 RepID=UPI001D0F8BE3|nr:helix-hairpin-helix domain-containing protein [Psychrobacter sanguinis]MCC3345994.1 helix-hairpin-helix domain-containing protein [Psychrobacter sanguinis]
MSNCLPIDTKDAESQITWLRLIQLLLLSLALSLCLIPKALAKQCFADAGLAYTYLIEQQDLEQQTQWAYQNKTINLNDASEAELTQLKGVGSIKAKQIIEPPRLYRRVDCLSQAALSDSLRLS